MDKNTGLVSFAQNKIASLRKICVNLRIAAGLFTNSSYNAYLRKHVKFTHLVCECTRVRNLWLCSKSHWKLFSFFRDWHNNHRLRTYVHQQKRWVILTCFRRYASQDEFVKSPAAIRKFTQNLRKLAILFCAKDTSPLERKTIHLRQASCCCTYD